MTVALTSTFSVKPGRRLEIMELLSLQKKLVESEGGVFRVWASFAEGDRSGLFTVVTEVGSMCQSVENLAEFRTNPDNPMPRMLNSADPSVGPTSRSVLTEIEIP